MYRDGNKILRHVKPCEVILKVNDKYVKLLKKENNYSYQWELNHTPSFFVHKKSKRTGKMLKSTISFYGNSMEDEGLYCFDTEKECVDKYNELIYEAVDDVEKEKQRVINEYNQRIKELKSKLVNTDYLMEKLYRN